MARIIREGEKPSYSPHHDLITQELSNQYAIGYTSKNPRRDGAFRRIVVRVAESNVRTRTRSGYQATTQTPQVSLNR